jgi:hypothetical protein
MKQQVGAEQFQIFDLYVGEAAGDCVTGFCAATEATEATSPNPQLNRMAVVSRVGTFRGARTIQATDRVGGI